MSSIYVLEPPTKGKVVLNTSLGPIDIELWPKEAPKAVRNFVQLCLEGYYDRTIFHRIIKSFLVQGGDPTGSGTGGESIYGGSFPDEFHTRLRFNHRGLVACANAGTPHSNGSQFFISLDRCDWLDKQNTIFGKVTGDSIFNLLRIGEVETDKNDRPISPVPRINSVEVLWNPFDDIVPRRVPEAEKGPPPEKKETKIKAVKNFKLLSFGEEAEEEEKELASVNKKIQSIHDVLNDPRFIKAEVEETEQDKVGSERKKELQKSVRESLTLKKVSDAETAGNLGARAKSESDDDDDEEEDGDEAEFDARMRSYILRKRIELGDVATKVEKSEKKRPTKDAGKPSIRENDEDEEGPRSKVEKLSMKKKGLGSEARSEFMAMADSDLQLLGRAEKERQLQKQKRRRLHGREEETLAKLEKFKKAFPTKAASSSSKELPKSSTEEDDVSTWMSSQLKFFRDPSVRDDMARKDDPNAYVVYDPLLEKGKEKFNKMQAKLKRREREWAGKSLT
ncbi:cyclophilin-like peptidyl-prolyl cis-trans isomerase family protein [Wolffia australiana]